MCVRVRLQEEMFLGLYDAVSAQSSAAGSAAPDCELHTVTMAWKASQAHLYVDGSEGLLHLLSQLQ